MSAFVCDDSTINQIVTGIENAIHHGGYGKPTPAPAPELAEYLTESAADFGKTLYLLNVNAVEQRYPDCVRNPNNLPGQVNEAGKHIPYRYRSTIPPRAVQLYKSIQCYLYQVNEGDAKEAPLYKHLQAYLDTLARSIVESSSDYNKANWG